MNDLSKLYGGCCINFIVDFIYFGSIATYYIFGVIYLEKYYEENLSCKYTNIWEYILVSMSLLLINMITEQCLNISNFKNLFFILYLLVTSWGFIELFDFNSSPHNYIYRNSICENIRYSILWDFGLASFIIYCLIIVLFLLYQIQIFFSKN